MNREYVEINECEDDMEAYEEMQEIEEIEKEVAADHESVYEQAGFILTI